MTGARRGIGAAIAARLVTEGAHVAVSARTADAGESRLPGTLAETWPASAPPPGMRWDRGQRCFAGLVDTPGVAIHGLITDATRDRVQPIEYIAEAVYRLASGDPAILTGRIAYARTFAQGTDGHPVGAHLGRRAVVSTKPSGGIAAKGHDLLSGGARLVRQSLHETPRGAGSAQGGRRFHMVDDQLSWAPTVSREHGSPPPPPSPAAPTPYYQAS